MDIDLFQGILLGLLALGLLILIALLSTLGGIRKALERASIGSEVETPAPVAAADTTRPEEATPATAEPSEQATPVATTAAAPVAQQSAPATETDTQAATIRAVLSQHGVADAATPAATTTPAASTPAASEPASVVAAHIDTEEPEDEPFQRDGRWWFKRGDEFLVYNEGTAQWEPAERPGHWSSAPGSATTTMTAAPGAGADAAATTVQPVVASAGSGWKCPSCGAINGSTAASCRMCFTARP